MSPVNSLIRELLIEGRTAEQKYEKDGYALKWTFVNDLELIFVVRPPQNSTLKHRLIASIVQVAYQRILQLTYIDDLLSAMRRLFIQYFEPVLTAFIASLHTMNTAKAATFQTTSWDFQKMFKSWDALFDKLLKELEDTTVSQFLYPPSKLRANDNVAGSEITPAQFC